MGQHDEANRWLLLPVVLLGLRDRRYLRKPRLGLTLGNWGGGDLSFLSNIGQADSRHLLFAIAGGAVFNVANLLLVAAIDIAGLAVAFPVGIGLALVVGVLLNYAISPQGPSRPALRRNDPGGAH